MHYSRLCHEAVCVSQEVKQNLFAAQLAIDPHLTSLSHYTLGSLGNDVVHGSVMNLLTYDLPVFRVDYRAVLT